MKNKLLSIMLLASLSLHAQTELLPSVAWRTYVSNVEMLTDSTYKFDVMPLDWNEAGASIMDYGNYFQDYTGNKYEVIDSAYLSVTVWDLFETGVSPQVDRIGVMYQSPEPNSEYLAPINYQYLDETALDNARAVELAYLWRQANLYAKDSANIVWWNDTIETIATKSDVPTLLTDLDSANFNIDTSQVRDLGAFVANNSGSASISGTEGYLPKFGASGLTESDIFEDGSGKVGIGSTNPTQKLDVVGNINIDSSSAYLFDGQNALKLSKNGEDIYYSTIVGMGAGNSASALSIKQTALGYFAGNLNTGDNQTALGYLAGQANTGAYQTALGYAAGYQNTGVNQTALGYAAGYLNEGHRVTGLGYYATKENTGDDVVAIGYEAGLNNTVANQFIVKQANINAVPLIQGDFATGNVGIGESAPSEKLEVNGNIKGDTIKALLDTTYANKTDWSEFIGSSSISGTEGYIPKFGASGLTESGLFEDASGNIGIGKTNPSEKLEVEGNVLINSTDNLARIRINGYNASTSGISTSAVIRMDNTYDDDRAIFSLRKNNGFSELVNSVYDGTNSIWREYFLMDVQTGKVTIDNTISDYNFLNSGNVGIGTTNPSEKLEVNGNIKGDEATELYHMPTWEQTLIDSFWVDGKITYYRQGGELDSIRGDADELEIGDFYQGGYIFYLSEDKETGMVCSPYLGTAQWSPTATLVGGTVGTVGSGGLNTTKIIDEFGVGNYAAYLCSQYSVFSYDDWFLPSTGELSLIYTNLVESGLVDAEILSGSRYSWASTEYDVVNNNSANAVFLENGSVLIAFAKLNINGYLAVRQFSTDYSGNLPAAGEEDILVYRNAEWTTLSRGLNGTFLGIEDNKVKYTSPSSSSGVTSVIAGVLVDVSGSTGSVTVNVDLSEATSDNTFSSTDQLVYLSGTVAKKGTVSGLQTYMQDNLDFGTGGGMVYPSAGIPVSTGSSWGSSITNNSSNWNTAYGWGDHSTKGYLTDAPSNGSLYGRKNGAWTVISTGTSAVTSVVAGNLVDVSSTTGDVTVNVDLSEATSDNTFAATDQLVYLSGTTQKRGTVSGLQNYMQSNLSFDSEWISDTYGINYQGGNVGIGTIASSGLRLYVNNVNTAIKGNSTDGYGVAGSSNTSTGVYGYSNGDYGLMGVSSANHAVFGSCTFTNTTKYAGFFSGGIGVNSQKGYSVNEVEVIDDQGVFIPAKIASAPTTPVAGMIYFNTNDKHFYGYNGTTWKQLDN